MELALLLEPAAPTPIECLELGAPRGWGTPSVRTGQEQLTRPFRQKLRATVWPLSHK